jgi:hypothetical protein
MENSATKFSKQGIQQAKINDYMDNGDKKSKNANSSQLNKRDSKQQQKAKGEMMAVNDWQSTAVVSCFTIYRAYFQNRPSKENQM